MSSNNKSLICYDGAEFLTSAQTLAQCPPDSGIEIAFAGRSNSGKSSAINTITRNGKLAKTSKTPGRTRLINFFSLGEPVYRLVDLPGYGYAKVSRSLVNSWQKNLQDYLEHRQSLRALIIVMDLRHPLTDFDCNMLSWCESRSLPTLALLTKADKLKRGQGKNILAGVTKDVNQWAHHINVQLFSSLNKTGIDEVKEYMNHFFLTSQDKPKQPQGS